MNTCPFNCKILHVGINAQGAQDAHDITQLICTVFGLEYRPGEKSDFAGTLVEVMHENGRGEKGHIALGVDSIEDAEAWIESQGHHYIMESAKYNEDGKMRLVYIDGSFGGFAIHFVRLPKEG